MVRGGSVSQNRIYVDLIDRMVSEGGFKKMGESMSQFEKQGRRTKNLAGSVAEVFQKDLPGGFRETSRVVSGTNARGEAFVKTFSNVERAQQRFNMNALGVMFAGMAMNRAMANLNSTSREWLGMGELMSDMMGITLLDANINLLEKGVLPLFDALTSLPGGAQVAIGYTTMALESLGAIMMTGGQLMLGLESTTNLLRGFGDGDIASGISKIQSKLSGLSKVAQFGGTAIAVSFALQDIQEGDLTGFLADAAMGIGFMTGNPWAIGIGISFKMLNEGLFDKIAVDFFDTVGYMVEWGSDALVKMFTLRADDIDWSGVTSIFDRMDKYAAEKVLSGEAKSAALINRMGGVEGAYMTLVNMRNEDIAALQDKYDSGLIPSEEELNSLIKETNDSYDIAAYESLPAIASSYDDIIDRSQDLLSNLKDIMSVISYISPGGSLSLATDLVSGAISSRAVGGPIRKNGTYYLHQGEEVITKNDVASGDVVISSTNNFYGVSSRTEMEQMIRANNDKLKSEIRRIVKV